MKTLKSIFIGLFLLMGIFAFAQVAPEQPGNRVDEMHARKWQFMVDQSKLNPKEIEAVLPIFMEYERLVWTQHEKNRTFFRSAFKSEGNTKPNYAALNDHYSEMDLLQGQMFKAYHLKLCRLLSPETLFRYYHAEREFKRKLLQDMSTRKRPQEPPR